jgi:hypothetical protein
MTEPAISQKALDEMGFLERERALIGHEVDVYANTIRQGTPAPIVNRGSQINFALMAAADAMSVWSGVKFKSYSRVWASSITLFTAILGIIYDEKPQSEEHHKKLAEQSWLNFAWEKTKNAFNPKDHILATAGLSTIVNGVLMARSGLKQSTPGKKSWETLQGALTAVAGMVMTYLPDRERAWQISKSIFWIRAPVAALQAHDALHYGIPEKNIDKGDWQQWAKWVFNQTANVFGFLYGGVEKKPDGTIVGHVKRPLEAHHAAPKLVAAASEVSTRVQTATIAQEMLENSEARAIAQGA